MNEKSLRNPGLAPPIALGELANTTVVARHTGRNMSKASVLFYGQPGRGVVLKTYEPSHIIPRMLVGRALISRELRAYHAIGECSGLPHCWGRVGPWALAMEWIDARPLADRRGERIDAQVFDRLEAIVAEVHTRGVALGDLHHRDVLLSNDQRVWIIDLAAALPLGDNPGLLRRTLYRRLRESDIVNLTRMRARFTGEDVDEAMSGLDPALVTRYRRGRTIKSTWDWMRRKK